MARGGRRLTHRRMWLGIYLAAEVMGGVVIGAVFQQVVHGFGFPLA